MRSRQPEWIAVGVALTLLSLLVLLRVLERLHPLH